MGREWNPSLWGAFYWNTQYIFFVIQFKIQSEESEEMAKFKDLFPDMKSPDSLYDKSPVG